MVIRMGHEGYIGMGVTGDIGIGRWGGGIGGC